METERTKLGFEISCSRCNISKDVVATIKKNVIDLPAHMFIQAVLNRKGWKLIKDQFVCPHCLSEIEKETDYTRSWYKEVFDLWEQYKIEIQ